MTDDPQAPARRAYEAYGEHAGWTSVTGDPMPPWKDLGDAVRGHWVAAVGTAAGPPPVATVRPGETLVIALPGRISREDLDDATAEIVRELRERLPGVKAVVLNADQLAVYRPGQADDG